MKRDTQGLWAAGRTLRRNSHAGEPPCAIGADGAGGVKPLEVVERFGEHWSAHDLEASLAMVADDGVFEATGPAPDGVRSAGLDAIRAAWTPIFEDRMSRFEVEETIVAGDRVIQLWRYDWTDGHVRGIDVFRVRGDQITEKISYVKG